MPRDRHCAVVSGSTAIVTLKAPGCMGFVNTAPTYSGTCTVAPITVAQGTSCKASYTFNGDANHTGSSDSASLTITP